MELDAAITYRGTVYPWHCDHMGHMNVTWYVSKFDEASWNFLRSIGITPAYLPAHVQYDALTASLSGRALQPDPDPPRPLTLI